MAAPRKESLKEEMKNMPDMQPHRMSDIMLRIIAFPIEQKDAVAMVYKVSYAVSVLRGIR